MTKKKPVSGYERDLRDAENAMIAAGHPDVALQMRRHSEAIRNYMQGAIVPMFVEMVERSLGPKIDGLRTDVQQWAQESATRLGKLETRMDSSEADRVDLRMRLERIERIMAERPEQREAEHQALLTAIRQVSGDVQS